MVLNPHRKYYAKLKETMTTLYEDVFWSQDAVFLERNSRDFIERIHRVDGNAEAVCEILLASPRGITPPSQTISSFSIVKRIFYPKYNPSRPNYEAFRKPGGGYGSLLSVIFHNDDHAVIFFDSIETAKGPSLGTNFTLISPYTILAHYTELEWAAQFGVEQGLVRISVGLEETDKIVSVVKSALKAIERSHDREGL
jgi:cystathionine gamma-synthase